MGDDGFHIAQIGSDGHQLRVVNHRECIAAAMLRVGTDHIKRQHRTAHGGLLLHRQGMLWMRWQAREMHFRHLGMLL